MEKENTVYLIQELPGTRIGQPKFNIMGALKYGKLKVLLKENTQIVLSPGPIVFELRRLLKDYTSNDYLLFYMPFCVLTPKSLKFNRCYKVF